MNQKEQFSLNIIKDPENTLGLLATIVEDLLHIHGGNNIVYSSSEVTNLSRPLLLPGVLREPRRTQWRFIQIHSYRAARATLAPC